MAADIFTKALARRKFEVFRAMIGVRQLEYSGVLEILKPPVKPLVGYALCQDKPLLSLLSIKRCFINKDLRKNQNREYLSDVDELVVNTLLVEYLTSNGNPRLDNPSNIFFFTF
jgi:hypothetical protein